MPSSHSSRVGRRSQPFPCFGQIRTFSVGSGSVSCGSSLALGPWRGSGPGRRCSGGWSAEGARLVEARNVREGPGEAARKGEYGAVYLEDASVDCLGLVAQVAAFVLAC